MTLISCGRKARDPADIGRAAAISWAAEPTMRAGSVCAARTASRSDATLGAINVRPLGPNTCR
jgi:hypothetical protein